MTDGRPHEQLPVSRDAPRGPGARDGRERLRTAIAAICAHTEESHSAIAHATELMGGARRPRLDASALRPELVAELRAALTAHVRSLRDATVPAERVVVLVKELVRDSTPPNAELSAARALLEEVVRWSIEIYYTG